MSESESENEHATRVGLDDPPCYGPMVRSFTLESLQSEMESWMVEEFGKPKELDDEYADKWFERNGVMLAFARNLFQP